MAAVTLDAVRAHAGVFPTDLLAGNETALLLFAGGFHGENDGIHFADAGIAATCVDILPDGLEVMRGIYPDSWEFVQADAFAFASLTDRRWDSVCVDSPTVLFERVEGALEAFSALARRLLIVGVGWAQVGRISAPVGWQVVRRIRRSGYRGGVFWLVMEPSP